MIDKNIDPALLKDNAFSVVQEEVKRVFTEGEITTLKADYFAAKQAEDTRLKAKDFFAQMLQNESNAMIQEAIKSLSKIDFGETGLKVLKGDASGLKKNQPGLFFRHRGCLFFAGLINKENGGL